MGLAVMQMRLMLAQLVLMEDQFYATFWRASLMLDKSFIIFFKSTVDSMNINLYTIICNNGGMDVGTDQIIIYLTHGNILIRGIQ